MKSGKHFALLLAATAVFILNWAQPASLVAQAQHPPSKPTPWTLDEVMTQLRRNPRDAYLQYVALQLARRAGRGRDVNNEIVEIVLGRGWARPNEGRKVDLFSLFTGMLAVQESLQLNAMGIDVTEQQSMMLPSDKYLESNEPAYVLRDPPPSKDDREKKERVRLALLEKRRNTVVNLSELRGPTIGDLAASGAGTVALASTPLQIRSLAAVVGLLAARTNSIPSHPWEQMLAGRRPLISPLARAVPEDYYYAEFRSFDKLLQVLDSGELWAAYIAVQTQFDAREPKVGERLRRQLALEMDPALRPFFEKAVAEVAVTGSDPFVRDGSDVTVLFHLKQPAAFRARLDGFVANTIKRRPDARRTTGSYMGVPYARVATPDRALDVIAADPTPDLHVRSNSEVAFRRVLEAVRGQALDGRAVRRLGDTAEFAYIRTLFLPGAKEEDGLIYFSDPFIRRLSGPRIRLTERRRLLCGNHLHMIGHAALLYRTQLGKAARSVEELVIAGCSPGRFGEGSLRCPDGGTYSLTADGTAGVCSCHGAANFLTPCCEIHLHQVTGEEADIYRAFLADYFQYWKTYFDPIALRVMVTPQRYRLETIVLPLIDNSIYTGLAKALRRRPESLDALPIPLGSIFSIAFQLPKDQLLRLIEDSQEDEASGKQFGFSKEEAENMKRHCLDFLRQGLGDYAGLHVYDAAPLIDLKVPEFLAMFVGYAGWAGDATDWAALVLQCGAAIGFLYSPVYVAFPVNDTALVDQLLEDVDKVLAILARTGEKRGQWLAEQPDFYRLAKQNRVIRSAGIRLGPVKVRVFWERIDNGLYVATKRFILDDIWAVRAKAAPDATTIGHALVRVRPANWNKFLPERRLGWAENNREACLRNLGPLASVTRAFNDCRVGKKTASGRRLDIQRQAEQLYGVHFLCPDGGHYELCPDEKSWICDIHGTALAPRQPPEPDGRADLGKLLNGFAGLTATLTFMDDGLHAVVTIDRK
jgi:hypothetical protein